MRTASLTVGPLPPAAELSQLEAIHPGVTQVLLKNFEKEGDTRREIALIQANNETRIIKAKAVEVWLSTGIAALLILVPTGAAVYFVATGATVSAAVSFISALGMLWAGKHQKQP